MLLTWLLCDIPSFSAIVAATILNLVFVISWIPQFLQTFATNVHISNYTVVYVYFCSLLIWVNIMFIRIILIYGITLVHFRSSINILQSILHKLLVDTKYFSWLNTCFYEYWWLSTHAEFLQSPDFRVELLGCKAMYLQLDIAKLFTVFPVTILLPVVHCTNSLILLSS